MQARFFWHGPLTEYESLCLTSFVRPGIEVQVFTFQDDLVLPEGGQRCDARELATEKETALFTQGGKPHSLAGFSNLFRYRLLERQPGWWFDTDVFCLKGVDEFQRIEETDKELVAGVEGPRKINTAVLFARSSDPGRELVKRFESVAEEHGNRVPWGALGPGLLTRWVLDNRDRVDLLPSEVFYPLHYKEAPLLLSPEHAELCHERCQNSLAVHLWNEVLRDHQVPKSLGPCEGSYLDTQFQRVRGNRPGPDRLPVGTLSALRRARAAESNRIDRLALRVAGWAKAFVRVVQGLMPRHLSGPFS